MNTEGADLVAEIASFKEVVFPLSPPRAPLLRNLISVRSVRCMFVCTVIDTLFDCSVYCSLILASGRACAIFSTLWPPA